MLAGGSVVAQGPNVLAACGCPPKLWEALARLVRAWRVFRVTRLGLLGLLDVVAQGLGRWPLEGLPGAPGARVWTFCPG